MNGMARTLLWFNTFYSSLQISYVALISDKRITFLILYRSINNFFICVFIRVSSYMSRVILLARRKHRQSSRWNKRFEIAEPISQFDNSSRSLDMETLMGGMHVNPRHSRITIQKCVALNRSSSRQARCIALLWMTLQAVKRISRSFIRVLARFLERQLETLDDETRSSEARSRGKRNAHWCNSIEKWSLKETARRTTIPMEESCCNPGRIRRCGCKSCRRSRKPSRTCRRDHRSIWRSPISHIRCERAAKIVSTLSIEHYAIWSVIRVDRILMSRLPISSRIEIYARFSFWIGYVNNASVRRKSFPSLQIVSLIIPSIIGII